MIHVCIRETMIINGCYLDELIDRNCESNEIIAYISDCLSRYIFSFNHSCINPIHSYSRFYSPWAIERSFCPIARTRTHACTRIPYRIVRWLISISHSLVMDRWNRLGFLSRYLQFRKYSTENVEYLQFTFLTSLKLFKESLGVKVEPSQNRNVLLIINVN